MRAVSDAVALMTELLTESDEAHPEDSNRSMASSLQVTARPHHDDVMSPQSKTQYVQAVAQFVAALRGKAAALGAVALNGVEAVRRTPRNMFFFCGVCLLITAFSILMSFPCPVATGVAIDTAYS
jgi:hypothetical protein